MQQTSNRDKFAGVKMQIHTLMWQKRNKVVPIDEDELIKDAKKKEDEDVAPQIYKN